MSNVSSKNVSTRTADTDDFFLVINDAFADATPATRAVRRIIRHFPDTIFVRHRVRPREFNVFEVFTVTACHKFGFSRFEQRTTHAVVSACEPYRLF